MQRRDVRQSFTIRKSDKTLLTQLAQQNDTSESAIVRLLIEKYAPQEIKPLSGTMLVSKALELF
jgi:hypothetical protein